MEGVSLGFVELLDHSGKVTERVRLTELPVSIGRAYDNDIIIDDPYICPHHARIELNESDQLIAKDLGSLNGLSRNGNMNRTARILLTSDTLIQIGHTRLRFRSAQYEVATTLPNHHERRFRGIYENRLVQILIFLVTLSALWASSFFETVERRDVPEPAFDLVLPVFLIMLWAGTWAFAGRVITHRIKFLVHCAVVCLALVTLFIFDTCLEYLAFALSMDHVRTLLSVFLGLTVLGVALYSHLRFATLASRVHLAVVAGAISVSILGLVALKLHVENTEFSVIPQNHATLKAPMFRLVEGETADHFFARLNKLRDNVVAQTTDPKQ